MPSHFDAVGFSVASHADLEELIRSALIRAASDDAVVEHPSGSTATYRDPSGALLAMHANSRDELVWAQPSFESDLRIRWRPQSLVRDEEDPSCDLVYAERLAPNDQMVYPFAMLVESIETDRELIPYTEASEVRVVGLCQSGNVWSDEVAFRDSDEAHVSDGPPRVSFGSQSFIPTGTFGEGGRPMTPQALAYGIVEAVEVRRNELTGETFHVARLDTYGGLLDTCWASEHGDGLALGAVARANLLLVGRPLTLRNEPGPVPVADGN